jgi:hypothetical protein
MHKTLAVQVSRVGELEKLVKRLARLAAKFHLSPLPSVHIDGSSRREVKQQRDVDGESRSYMVQVVNANIVLPDAPVKSEGWNVIGILDRTTGGLEITASPEYLSVIEAYRTKVQECQHCHANRNRVHTLVIQHSDGRTMQVGRECAHHYSVDASLQIDQLSFQERLSSIDLFDDDAFPSNGYGVPKALDVMQALYESCAYIRHHGFVPSAHADEFGNRTRNDNATWRMVQNIMEGTGVSLGNESDILHVEDILNYIESAETDNEVVLQARSLIDYGACSYKKLALIAATVVVVDREIAKKYEVAPTTPAPEGRVEVTGTVLSVKSQAGMYGISWKMLVKLEDNNKVWCSVPSSGSFVKGNKVTFVATFKRSKDDEHFSYGSRPKLPKAPKRAEPAVLSLQS